LKPKDPRAAKEPLERTPRRGDAKSTAAEPTRALVILPDPRRSGEEGARGRSGEARLAEAVALAEAIGLDVKAAQIVPLRKPAPGTLLGSGKVEEIAALARIHDAELVIVDHPLSPVQQSNLRKVDRQGVGPHRADPRDFRRKGADEGGTAAG